MKRTGLSRQTLHNYTVLGLIEEAGRTDGGHRLYSHGMIERVARINRLKRHHTLAEVRELLKQWNAKRGEQ